MNTITRTENNDVYQDLKTFNDTKDSVNELLKFKRGLIDNEHADFETISKMKEQALTAIDNLFSEDDK